jgi:hypothetical protein
LAILRRGCLTAESPATLNYAGRIACGDSAQGVLNKAKPFRLRRIRGFLFSCLIKQACEAFNKKPLRFQRKGFAL